MYKFWQNFQMSRFGAYFQHVTLCHGSALGAEVALVRRLHSLVERVDARLYVLIVIERINAFFALYTRPLRLWRIAFG